MNEGCHGGWGLFNGMFLEDHYTCARDYAPYTANTDFDSCHKYRNVQPLAKVDKTYYVGGHYGGMSENDMMWELRAHGPFLFDFNAGQAFQLYKHGILSEQGFPRHVDFLEDEALKEDITSDSVTDAPNTITAEDYGIQYSQLTHSTLLIGYGSEPSSDGGTESFWIVRNSYGPNWGEHGNFRIRRGLNDFAGEEENSAVVPLLFNENGQIREHGYN